MRRVIYGAAVSLDGYIARADGSVDWLVMEPEYDWAGMMANRDAILMGRKTWEIAQKMAPPEGLADDSGATSYVFSRTMPEGKHKGAEFTRRPIAEVVAELKAKPGKDIWLMGGGDLARSAWEADVIDRLEIAWIPVLLGAGIPMFPGPFAQKNFKLVKSKAYSLGMLEAIYEK